MKLEEKIITGALKKFTEYTNLDCSLVEETGDQRVEILQGTTNVNSKSIILDTVVVPHITSQNIEWALAKVRNTNSEVILFTRYLTISLSELLHRQKIQFMDIAGNCYINTAGILIYISGKKLAAQDDYREKTNLAFNAAGAAVLFLYLSNSLFASLPVRRVAKIANVSKATVSLVNRGLLRSEFITEEKTIIKRQQLFERWLIAFNEQLKSKLFLGKYSSDNENFWRDIRAENEIISGEAGAVNYINGHKSYIGIIYTNNSDALIKSHKLFPDENGVIEIRRKFWNDSEQENLAVDIRLLVYADIMTTRNNLSREQKTNLRNLVFCDGKISDTVDEFFSSM
ncbi:MAG: hypothetical protein HY963_03745 [Ignavibacteriales bacterium]|nr:hypothetical protein [Ignavibacteriales bacterium]